MDPELRTFMIPGAYELPKTAKEHTSVSYRKINRATAVVIDSVVAIVRVQSGLAVWTRPCALLLPCTCATVQAHKR